MFVHRDHKSDSNSDVQDADDERDSNRDVQDADDESDSNRDANDADEESDSDPGVLDEETNRLIFRNPDPRWIKSNRTNGSGYLNVSWDASQLKWRLKVNGMFIGRYRTAREACDAHPELQQKGTGANKGTSANNPQPQVPGANNAEQDQGPDKAGGSQPQIEPDTNNVPPQVPDTNNAPPQVTGANNAEQDQGPDKAGGSQPQIEPGTNNVPPQVPGAGQLQALMGMLQQFQASIAEQTQQRLQQQQHNDEVMRRLQTMEANSRAPSKRNRSGSSESPTKETSANNKRSKH